MTSFSAGLLVVLVAVCQFAPAADDWRSTTDSRFSEPPSRIVILDETFWVATSGDDINGDGSASNPWATIQHAFDQAADGDTVRVMPGTYNECIDAWEWPTQRSIALVADAFLLDPDNPDSRLLTVIDGTGVCSTLHSVINLGGYNSRVEGFTITGGVASAIFTIGGAVITNNVITGNDSMAGGGIYVYPMPCFYGDTVTEISNNLIGNNSVTWLPGYDKSGTGGGIFVSAIAERGTPNCFGGSPTITVTNNVIQNNSTDYDGGGAFLYTYTPSGYSAQIAVTGNLITANQAGIGGPGGTAGFGGGIYATTYGFGEENITIEGNHITLNAATGYGGGVWGGIDAFVLANQALAIDGNLITDNGAGTGGGIELIANVIDLAAGQSIALTMADNTVSGNIATNADELGGGGGLSAGIFSRRTTTPNMDFVIRGNQFLNNLADLDGGGVEIQVIADSENFLDPYDTEILPARATVEFVNNLVALNETTNSFEDAVGGGMLVFLQAFGESTATVNLDLETIADNATQTGAGGIEVECYTGFDSGPGIEGEGVLNIDSSIVYGNSGFGLGGPFTDYGIFQPLWDDPVNPNSFNLSVGVTYSDFFGNLDNDLESWIGGQPYDPGAFNIWTDPLFQIADPGYHLQPASPAVDAGNPLPSPIWPDVDLDGEARLFDGDWNGEDRVDMGADEVHAVALIVYPPPVLTLECNTMGGVASTDPQIVDWFEDIVIEGGCGEPQVSNDAPPLFPVGTTIVTFTVTDECGSVVAVESTVTVADTTTPEIAVLLTPATLWPPNHGMRAITASVDAIDVCAMPDVTLLAITSSEPDDAAGGGDGHTTNDIQDAELGAADFSFLLRAERSGNGSGRIYTVTYAATDDSGNEVSSTAAVTVPHNVVRKPTAVGRRNR